MATPAEIKAAKIEEFKKSKSFRCSKRGSESKNLSKT
jgi:hypothetical protein